MPPENQTLKYIPQKPKIDASSETDKSEWNVTIAKVVLVYKL